MFTLKKYLEEMDKNVGKNVLSLVLSVLVQKIINMNVCVYIENKINLKIENKRNKLRVSIDPNQSKD